MKLTENDFDHIREKKFETLRTTDFDQNKIKLKKFKFKIS